MIRNLLTAEAHRDPYVWAAVLLAHFAIGCILWAALGLWAVAVYAAFELVQGVISQAAWWDSVLDWCAVALGVTFASFLWGRDAYLAAGCAMAALIIAACGYASRSMDKGQ